MRQTHCVREWLLAGWLMLTVFLSVPGIVKAAPLAQDNPAELGEEGVALFLDGQHAEASPLLEAGYAGRDEASFDDLDVLGMCALALGMIQYETSNRENALESFIVALEVFQKSGNRMLEGTALAGIGGVYHDQGDNDEALEYLEQALVIHREVGDSTTESTTLNIIGRVYSTQGRYEEALEYYQQTLSIHYQVGNRRGVGTELGNIGLVYWYQGRYDEALKYYQQALGIVREVNDREGEGTVLDNIGQVYDAQGRYDEALKYYQQALAIRREVDDRAGEGITLNNMGGVYDVQGHYDEALEHYEQARDIHRTMGDRVNEGTALNNMGIAYRAQEHYDEALDSYEQALTIYRAVGDLAGEGTVLGNIGDVYHAQERYDEALEYYGQALSIHRQTGNRTVEAATLANIGGVYRVQGSYVEALEYFEQAMDVFEAVRATAGSEEGRASFIAEYADLYTRATALYFQEEQDEQAFHTSERGRARTFLDSLATGTVQLSDDAASELLERESTLYTERQATQNALARALAVDPPDDDLIADLEADLDEIEADYAAVQEEIAARGDQLAALVPGRSAVPELEEIQAALDADTALLSYWVTDEQTFAFVVTTDMLEVVALEVTRDDLLDRVETLRRFADLGETHPSAAVELHELLIAPLEEHLTTEHLAIVPHDVLHYLPFAALFDGERFLVDDYTLTLLPSASSLLHIQQNTGHELTAPLVIGNPATDNHDLPALGGAEAEAETIAELFGSTPLLGAAATEVEVRDGAAEAGILHVAAHGAFEQAAPLESTLYLTPDGDDDGRLTVREIYGLDLQQADLVVLSACETQIDDTGIVHGQLSVDSGDELVGLTRAFFYAGTPSVVSTLWRVEDEPSALLMEHFYTHLRSGMGKAEALRQAQMDVREDYPNPYYWAGYVLSGDGGIDSNQAASNTTTQDGSDTSQGGGGCLNLGFIILAVGVMVWWGRSSIAHTG